MDAGLLFSLTGSHRQEQLSVYDFFAIFILFC